MRAGRHAPRFSSARRLTRIFVVDLCAARAARRRAYATRYCRFSFAAAHYFHYADVRALPPLRAARRCARLPLRQLRWPRRAAPDAPPRARVTRAR